MLLSYAKHFSFFSIDPRLAECLQSELQLPFNFRIQKSPHTLRQF